MSVYCNVYGVDRIVLTCTVSSLISLRLDPSNLNIKWFFNNGTDHELTTGTNETRREGGNGAPVVISSTLALSVVPQDNAARLAPGAYYCQVEVNDETMRSNPSQQFMALDQEGYLQYGTSCLERSFIAEESACAVHDIAIVNPTTIDSSENSITINHPNVTEVTTVQEADTTMMLFIQSTPNQNDGVPEIWIYILVSVLAIFLIIIVILTVFVLRFCLIRKSQASNNTDRN